MADLLAELEAKVAALKEHYANVAREDTDANGDPLVEQAGAGASLAEESDASSDDKS